MNQDQPPARGQAPKPEENNFLQTEISDDEKEDESTNILSGGGTLKDSSGGNVEEQEMEMPRSHSLPNFCFNPDIEEYQYEIQRDFRQEINEYLLFKRKKAQQKTNTEETKDTGTNEELKD